MRRYRQFSALLPLFLLPVILFAFPHTAEAAKYGYVANYSNNTVSVIDTGTNTVVKSIVVGSHPYAAVTSGTGVYVTNASDNTVSIIDARTNTVIKTVSVGNTPDTITTSGTGVYVINFTGNSVSIIDTRTNTVVKTLSVGSSPFGGGASGTGVYIMNTNSNNVSIIDIRTNTVVKTLSVGAAPGGNIGVSGTGVYVANLNGQSVSIIDNRTNTVARTVSLGAGPYGVTINGTGAYMPLSTGAASIIDIRTSTVVKTVSIGSAPRGIDATGTGVYIVNSGSASVSVIDSRTNTVVRTITVGSNPQGIAIGPDVTADLATQSPILTSPLSSSNNTRSLAIAFTLPESASAGSVSMNFSDGGSTNTTITLNDTASASFTLDLADIAGSSHVVSTTGPVPNGTYSITLSYQDYLSNPASTTTNTNVIIATPSSSSSSSSSQENVQHHGGGSRVITLEMKKQAAIQRFGGSTASSSGAGGGSSSSAAAGYFKDVPPSAWFHASVEKMRVQGVISGYKNTGGQETKMYGPADDVTYGQFAKMILSVTKRPPSNPDFRTHWAEPYVREAKAQGLSVYQSPLLNADAKATRGAVVRTILEVYGISVGARSQLVFTDLPANHPYAKDILTAAAVGIINGDDTTHTVRPDAPVNRAEISKILNLLSTKFIPKETPLSSSALSSGTTPTKNVTLKPAAGADMRTVQTPILHVRSDSRLNASLLWTAQKGQQMEVLEIVHKKWAHIRTSDGREGYVWADYVR